MFSIQVNWNTKTIPAEDLHETKTVTVETEQTNNKRNKQTKHKNEQDELDKHDWITEQSTCHSLYNVSYFPCTSRVPSSVAPVFPSMTQCPLCLAVKVLVSSAGPCLVPCVQVSGGHQPSLTMFPYRSVQSYTLLQVSRHELKLCGVSCEGSFSHQLLQAFWSVRSVCMFSARTMTSVCSSVMYTGFTPPVDGQLWALHQSPVAPSFLVSQICLQFFCTSSPEFSSLFSHLHCSRFQTISWTCLVVILCAFLQSPMPSGFLVTC